MVQYYSFKTRKINVYIFGFLNFRTVSSFFYQMRSKKNRKIKKYVLKTIKSLNMQKYAL